MIASVLTSLIPQSSADEGIDTIFTDGRLVGINIESDQTYSESWPIKENEWYSVIMECESCTGTISIDGTIIETSSNDLTGMAEEDGIVELSIESTLNELIGLSIVHNVTESFDSLRPSPSQQTDYIESKICTESDYCQNYSRGNLNSIPNGELTSPAFISGVIDTGQSEFFAIEVFDGDTLELSLFHSTSDITVEVFFQNTSSELLMNGSLSINGKMVANEQLQPMLWHFDDNGRAIVKVHSSSVNTVWSLQSTVFKSQDIISFSNLITEEFMATTKKPY